MNHYSRQNLINWFIHYVYLSQKELTLDGYSTVAGPVYLLGMEIPQNDITWRVMHICLAAVRNCHSLLSCLVIFLPYHWALLNLTTTLHSHSLNQPGYSGLSSLISPRFLSSWPDCQLLTYMMPMFQPTYLIPLTINIPRTFFVRHAKKCSTDRVLSR